MENINFRESSFDEFHGPISSPLDMVSYCVHMGRQTGKTYKMIMSIPNEPIVIIVHKQSYGKEIIRRLKELRPDYDVKNIKFVTHGVSKQLAGNILPIWVDNCVLDMIQSEYVKQMNKYYGPRK